jgi:hypothetical protein
MEFRDFESMDEVRRTGEIVDEIVAGAEVCFGILGVPSPAGARLEAEGVVVAGLEDIDLRNLLATGLVNLALRGAFDITPLERDSIEMLFETRPESVQVGGRRLKPAVVKQSLAWLREQSAWGPRDWPAVERFTGKALAGVEDEFMKVRSWADVDPRYIRSVILRR